MALKQKPRRAWRGFLEDRWRDSMPQRFGINRFAPSDDSAIEALETIESLLSKPLIHPERQAGATGQKNPTRRKAPLVSKTANPCPASEQNQAAKEGINIELSLCNIDW